MTRKKKSIYISVLGVGLCVVAYDLISGEDAPAMAVGAGTPASNGADSAPRKSDLQAGLSTLSVPHFPSEFGPLVPGTALRDVFAPTEFIMNQLKHPQKEPGAEGQDEQEAEAPPEPFSKLHSLSAIMVWADSKSAIVDGKVLREGQSLSDCLVTDIGDRNVRFRCGDTLEELWLVDPLVGERSE